MVEREETDRSEPKVFGAYDFIFLLQGRVKDQL